MGLNVNEAKRKVMKILESKTMSFKVNNYTFKNLKVNFNQRGDWNVEIYNIKQKVGDTYFALVKYFKSKLLSKRTKIQFYITTVRENC